MYTYRNFSYNDRTLELVVGGKLVYDFFKEEILTRCKTTNPEFLYHRLIHRTVFDLMYSGLCCLFVDITGIKDRNKLRKFAVEMVNMDINESKYTNIMKDFVWCILNRSQDIDFRELDKDKFAEFTDQQKSEYKTFLNSNSNLSEIFQNLSSNSKYAYYSAIYALSFCNAVGDKIDTNVDDVSQRVNLASLYLKLETIEKNLCKCFLKKKSFDLSKKVEEMINMWNIIADQTKKIGETCDVNFTNEIDKNFHEFSEHVKNFLDTDSSYFRTHVSKK